jgi:hypothetical protein
LTFLTTSAKLFWFSGIGGENSVIHPSHYQRAAFWQSYLRFAMQKKIGALFTEIPGESK